MTPRELVLNQLAHKETAPVPYSVGFEGDVVERLTEYYGSPSWREKLQPYICVIAEPDLLRAEPIDDRYGRDAFGGVWRLDKRPMYLAEPALSEPSLRGFKLPSPEVLMEPYLGDSPGRIMAGSPDSYYLVKLLWGIFEHTWHILGMENALIYSATETSFYEDLLDMLTEFTLEAASLCRDLPADAIFFGDDWGDQRGVILGPDRWRALIKPRWTRVYKAVHAQGKKVCSHCCGSVAEILPDIIEMGLDVLQSVQPEAAGMNPYGLKERFGDKIVFYGGLGSQSTIRFGTPQDIHNEVERLCREMGRGGGYILQTAKPLQPDTPTENAVAVVEAFTNQRS